MQGTPKKTSKVKFDWLRATASIDVLSITRLKVIVSRWHSRATAVQELGAKRHGDWRQRTGECVVLMSKVQSLKARKISKSKTSESLSRWVWFQYSSCYCFIRSHTSRNCSMVEFTKSQRTGAVDGIDVKIYIL